MHSPVPCATEADRRRFTPFLAADVGGTHARIGLVGPSEQPETPVKVLRYSSYECARYQGLEEILREFLGSGAADDVQQAAIACAGYPDGDSILNKNLPWPVSMARLRSSLGLREVRRLNDFEALAYATPYIDPAHTSVLVRGAADARGPVLVVGPGTGLGAALRVQDGRGATMILSTEAGQAGFAPSTPRELAVLGHLLRNAESVSIERLLSGPGLLTLYRTLGALDAVEAPFTQPAEVTGAALLGKDELARDALQTFCGLMGSVIGDLVLIYGAQGGVYLAGGILPRIRAFLEQSDFAVRFLAKGAMRSILERVPVRVIEHGQLGVIGAAAWFLDQGA